MDKESRDAIVGEGQARLYICDRRRYVSMFISFMDSVPFFRDIHIHIIEAKVITIPIRNMSVREK